jgi:choline dehydrogenase-like flavoprotein
MAFEVAIVGSGPAGPAAALVLSRMRRRVLLLDVDEPANGVSDAVHGLFGHDGTSPLELRRIAREQLRPDESVTVRMVAVDKARPDAGRLQRPHRRDDERGRRSPASHRDGVSCRRSRVSGRCGREARTTAPTVCRGRHDDREEGGSPRRRGRVPGRLRHQRRPRTWAASCHRTERGPGLGGANPAGDRRSSP